MKTRSCCNRPRESLGIRTFGSAWAGGWLFFDPFPRVEHGAPDGGSVGVGEVNPRASLTAPRACRRNEHLLRRAHELALLLGCEHDDSPLLLRIERREDAPVHPEVGVAHVGLLDRAFEREHDSTEVIAGHDPSFVACTRFAWCTSIARRR